MNAMDSGARGRISRAREDIILKYLEFALTGKVYESGEAMLMQLNLPQPRYLAVEGSECCTCYDR